MHLSKYVAWAGCHKVKILGFAAMFISALQLNFEYILEAIPANYRPWILFTFGMAAAVIGWINTQSQEDQYKALIEESKDASTTPH